MILDDLKRQNKVFNGFFWRFRAATHILRANCTEITTDKPEQPVYEIFFTLNVDVNGSSLDPVDSKLPAQEGIKDGCPLKSRSFTAIGCARPITLSGECKCNGFHNHRVKCHCLDH